MKKIITTIAVAGSLFAFNLNAADIDKDGLPNNAEKILGTNPYSSDTDGDGINDKKDKNPTLANVAFKKSNGKKCFSIKEVLVENNYDEIKRKDAPDHLEIIVKNRCNNPISDFTTFYTMKDLKNSDKQSYILPLSGFTIGANEKKSIHIDVSHQKGHFQANPNSLYYNSLNEIKVNVILSAKGYQAQKGSVVKDAGGAEVAD
jgi:hypothetical protein